jgi:hypothetical protein
MTKAFENKIKEIKMENEKKQKKSKDFLKNNHFFKEK